MAVETSAETLLIQEMGNQTNGTAENEKTVQNTHSEIVLSLFRKENSKIT